MARILIVDDQKSVLLTLEALLTQHLHTVVACNNAIEAVHALTREHFDLVITDAIMPGGSDGYALTRTIRRHPTLGKTPVILLTGKREKVDIEKGIDAGVNDYVVKPLDPELLIAKIGNLLVSDSQGSVHFAEALVNVPAQWEIKTEVKAVSELGMQLNSSIPLPVGRILRLSSAIFAEIEIPQIPLRIDSCEEVAGSESVYKIQAHFVGITEKEMAPIRLWLRSKKNLKV